MSDVDPTTLDWTEFEEVWQDELAAYQSYLTASRGENERGRVLPKKVDAARNAWYKALDARQAVQVPLARALGVKVHEVPRVYAENMLTTGKKVKR